MALGTLRFPWNSGNDPIWLSQHLFNLAGGKTHQISPSPWESFHQWINDFSLNGMGSMVENWSLMGWSFLDLKTCIAGKATIYGRSFFERYIDKQESSYFGVIYFSKHLCWVSIYVEFQGYKSRCIIFDNKKFKRYIKTNPVRVFACVFRLGAILAFDSTQFVGIPFRKKHQAFLLDVYRYFLPLQRVQ